MSKKLTLFSGPDLLLDIYKDSDGDICFEALNHRTKELLFYYFDKEETKEIIQFLQKQIEDNA
jgi:hypothetical protein